MKRVWILNDLFVSPSARKIGEGQGLMESSKGFWRRNTGTGV